MKNLKVSSFFLAYIKKMPYKAWASHFFVLFIFIFSRVMEYPIPRWIFWLSLINIHYTFLKKMFLKYANIDSNNNAENNVVSYSYLDPWRGFKAFSNFKELFKAYAITYYILFVIFIFFVLFLMPISYFMVRILYFFTFLYNFIYGTFSNLFIMLHNTIDPYQYEVKKTLDGPYVFFFYKLTRFQKFLLHFCYGLLLIVPVYKIFKFYMDRFGFLIARFWTERDGMIIPFTNPIVNEKPLKNWKIINLLVAFLSFILYELLLYSKYYELYEIFLDEAMESTQYISNEIFIHVGVIKALDNDIQLSIFLSIIISILFFWLYLKCLVYAKFVKDACIKSTNPKELFN